MAYMSPDTSILNNISPEHRELLHLFNRASQLPKELITQNSHVMQAAFLSVPQHTWMEHLNDLMMALRTKKTTDNVRRFLVTARNSGLGNQSQQLLDQAMLQKYEELTDKVRYDYDGFFPYRIAKLSKQLLILEKLEFVELTNYVLNHV